MASPEPPVALKDHCSIIHDNILYVYSPDAFQTLPLTINATWTQEQNGVSVKGGQCVKGGLDGDSQNPALYVVGGTTNGSVSGYSGLQRYSIRNKKWDTLNPMSQITANRQNHGAAYLNASSAILVYGGSQNGNTGLSTETFLMLMYPPYRVQAYPSTAPPAIRPSLLGFSEDKALLVGGGNGNQKVFTFHPDPGWVNLGVTLPFVLPDSSLAQVNLQTLADGSKILQTYYTNETPNRVTRNIITNPGFVPAPNAPSIGDAKAGSRLLARQLIQGNYPPYNGTNAPTISRTGASVASDGNTVALVGGDSNSTVTVFDSTGNRWLDTQAVFGDVQKPLTTSSSATASTPTASQTLAATPASSTPAAPSADSNQTNGLAVLGGVLGGICGFAAILIIVLLWLRSVRRRKRSEEAAKNKSDDSPYPDDKLRTLSPHEDGGLQPLSLQAQPMGRSPVPSAAISEADSMAMFGKVSEKQLEAQNHPTPGSRLNPNHGANNSSLSGFFKSNNKTPFAISKPMMPDLGDYKERPSIDLGKATPSTAGAPALPPIATAAAVASQQKADQRKTDEGWAKYFQADNKESKPEAANPYAVPYEEDPRRSTSRPGTAKGAGGGFWPGSGVPSSSNRSTKLPLRDSEGNTLTHAAVTTASPSIGNSDSNPQTRNMSIAAPAQAKFSSADSISTDHSSDDGYEDDEVDNYSERDSFAQWNPIGNTWSGPSQRPLRPPSVRIGASAFPPPPTSLSEDTTHTSNSGGSSLPAFPLPAASIGRADTTDQYVGTSNVERPPTNYASKNPYAHARKSSNTMQFNPHTSMDYFGRPDTASTAGASSKAPAVSDMSWLNLGTPAGTQVQASPQPPDARDPA